MQYNTGTNKQYNGNIAYQLYQSAATPATTTYTYLYDQLNRLTAGTSSDNYNESGITYDLQGNIQTLQRTYGSTTAIDNLTYSYAGTNQVQSISDIAPDVSTGKGYKFSNGSSFAYIYDANGNMLNDASKGITTNITYNLLNLPVAYTVPAGTSTFTYDAAGNKMRKAVVNGGNTVTNDYIGGIQYYNGAISFIQTEEGKALWNGSTYIYNYYLTDHLGNTRLTFDSHTTTATQLQQDDYMPFGMEISRGNVASPKNEYLFGKKELQEELGLSDFGGRYYDAVTGRWTTPDPLAELNRRFTLYNYTQDNPIGRIDPDGMYDQALVDQWKAENLASAGYNETQIAGALEQQQSPQQPPKKKTNCLKPLKGNTAAKKDGIPQNKKPNALQLAMNGGVILTATQANEGFGIGPYKAGTFVREFKAFNAKGFVRVSTNGKTEAEGQWIMREQDIQGLSPEEIQAKYSLPNTPDQVADVEIPNGQIMRSGIPSAAFTKTAGEVVQYQLIGEGAKFSNIRPLGALLPSTESPVNESEFEKFEPPFEPPTELPIEP